mmetsp:Transcript_26239/g.104973  ORF Transcript_26239/g.104973 Transcript_26239/m.104973 type:complete len:280 (-) Transcript_26239:2160-2999(-)
MASLRIVDVKGTTPPAVDDTATRMTCRAVDMNPLCSTALIPLAHHIFWSWKRFRFDASVLHGSCEVSFIDHASMLAPGVDVRLQISTEQLEARILSIKRREPTGWVMFLSKSVSLEHDHNHGSDSHVEVPLFWRDTPRVEELASRAYYCTQAPDARADAQFILGRNRHVIGDLSGALPYYTRACKLAPDHGLAQYRLAQVLAGMSASQCGIAKRADDAQSSSCFKPSVFDSQLLWRLGKCNNVTGDFASALHAAKQASDLSLGTPEVIECCNLLSPSTR